MHRSLKAYCAARYVLAIVASTAKESLATITEWALLSAHPQHKPILL
jgi:hypothetical protein